MVGETPAVTTVNDSAAGGVRGGASPAAARTCIQVRAPGPARYAAAPHATPPLRSRGRWHVRRVPGLTQMQPRSKQLQS